MNVVAPHKPLNCFSITNTEYSKIGSMKIRLCELLHISSIKPLGHWGTKPALWPTNCDLPSPYVLSASTPRG